jgi:hypothetical protein
MTKRKRKSGTQLDTDSSGPKRARQSVDGNMPIASQSVSYGRVDPTYGQRSAIPGLDDAGEDVDGAESDVEYSVDVEALRYLRSVRCVVFFF